MAYYIKEKLGYFPYIELKVTNGEFFSNGKVQQIKQPEIRDVGKFIETNEGRYEFWLENVNPINPLY